MTQYPDEKSNNPYHQWVQPPPEQSQYPTQQGPYSAPEGPPPAYSQPYASRDGAPPMQGWNQPPPVQGYYQPPQVSPQGFYPPQGPPQGPHQGYQAPQGAPYDQKGTHGYPEHRMGPPPPNSSYDQGGAGPSGYQLYQQPPSSSSPYSPSPDAGPSSQDRAQSSGGGMSLSSFFGNSGPPPMWQRQPLPGLPYNQFPPMCLISNSKELSKGFPELPPPCQLNPHPFSTHDITEEDWKRFLNDVKKGGSLSPTQRIKSNVIPMVTGASLIGGFFMTNMIERKMKFKNRTAAGDVVDHWNHYFFGPRRMEVVLCQASERLSGREGAAPIGDPNQQRMANGLRRRSSDSSSDESSSSDSEDDRKHAPQQMAYKSDRRARRAARREARSQRRAERRARKADRRARKARGEFQEPYQLFIQPI